MVKNDKSGVVMNIRRQIRGEGAESIHFKPFKASKDDKSGAAVTTLSRFTT